MAAAMQDLNPIVIYSTLIPLMYFLQLLMFCFSKSAGKKSYICLILFTFLESYLQSMLWQKFYFNRETSTFDTNGYVLLGIIGVTRVAILAGPIGHTLTYKKGNSY